MKLKKEKYNKKITVYYHNKNKLTERLIEDAIKLFFNTCFDEKLTLVRNREGRQVFKLEANGNVYYLKKFQYRYFKKLLKNLFRSEEAVRSYKKTFKLLNADILVVEPIAAITYRRGIFIFDSILITKEYKCVTVQQYLIYNGNERLNREKAFKNLAKLWAKLFNNKFLHRDYNLNNFMIDESNHSLVLADIDNIYFCPLFLKKIMITNLARFNARLLSSFIENDIELLSYRERILFLREFINHYSRYFNLRKFITKVNKETIKRLIKKDKITLITKDKWLLKLKNELIDQK